MQRVPWSLGRLFLHPNIIAPYDYIFIWDEDLGVEHFDSEEYIKLVRKHGLEISQPGLDPSSRGLTWQMTKRRGDREVHKETEEKPGWCSDPHLPPCVGLCLTKMEIGMFAELGWHPLLGSAHAVLQVATAYALAAHKFRLRLKEEEDYTEVCFLVAKAVASVVIQGCSILIQGNKKGGSCGC
ncbi:hypothetical protein CTI12_AA322950 [Artemisia annua]|uniref:Uncharacterized protein n=1 Tax=Artemisia annua TaxID=35608 RepID=A0A2U1MZR4_ARTAN|nr:hypothetical protein CTI12_AA322950 [Artemisia annua]